MWLENTQIFFVVHPSNVQRLKPKNINTFHEQFSTKLLKDLTTTHSLPIAKAWEIHDLGRVDLEG